jgi:hypothetical protein
MEPLHPGTFEKEAGEFDGTYKELYWFRTAAQQGEPLDIARAFLRANCHHLGLDLVGLRHRKTVASLGAWHVIMQQHVHGRPVHRGYVTVHMSNKGEVYLIKNGAMPRKKFPKVAEDPEWADYRITETQAVTQARRTLPNPSRLIWCLEAKPRWFPKGPRLIAAWRVRLERRRPREEWIVWVNGQNGRVLSKYDNLARAIGYARVFDPSPVVTLGDYKALVTPKGNPKHPPDKAYSSVLLYGLKPNGRLEGKRVTTSPTRSNRRVQRRNFTFEFYSHQKGFEEVMVYYHIDRAIRYLESLGYRKHRAIFRKPVRVNVNGTRQDNAWYSPGKKLLTYGIGQIDEAEDGETILHELGHAIQDAIVPDFGQSPEAAAIGEGFGDYFAASFFAEKKPERYRTTVITWDGLLIGLQEQHHPPGLRRVDEQCMFDDFDERRDEHSNGKIWSATLWEIRRKLGRDITDRIVLDSHFQLDGFTTFKQAARAILDADQNLYGGAHHQIIRHVFGKRRLKLGGIRFLGSS